MIQGYVVRIKLDEDMLFRLSRIAKVEERTRHNLIRVLLREGIEKREEEKEAGR